MASVFPVVMTVRGHTFLRSCLPPHPVVVDLGAHRGEFALEMIGTYGARAYAVEASPRLFQALPRHERLDASNYAICARDGEVTFNLCDNPEMSSIHAAPGAGGQAGPSPSAEKVVVAGRSLPAFFAEKGLGSVDLMKVDIEGAEIDVFESCPDDVLRRVRQISIEFHDFCGYVTAAQTARAIARLRGLGFGFIDFSTRRTDCLFVQGEACGIGPVRQALVKHVVRNVRGVGRVVRRRLFGEPSAQTNGDTV